MAEMKQVTVQWNEGRRFDATTESGVVVQMDASRDHGGVNGGAQPMELLLMGLAGCSGMDVISILEKKRQLVTGLQIKVEGARRDEHPRVYTDITVTYLVSGINVDPNAVARAIDLSTTKYCPVYATLSPTVTMHTRFELLEPAF